MTHSVVEFFPEDAEAAWEHITEEDKELLFAWDMFMGRRTYLHERNSFDKQIGDFIWWFWVRTHRPEPEGPVFLLVETMPKDAYFTKQGRVIVYAKQTRLKETTQEYEDRKDEEYQSIGGKAYERQRKKLGLGNYEAAFLYAQYGKLPDVPGEKSE